MIQLLAGNEFRDRSPFVVGTLDALEPHRAYLERVEHILRLHSL
jgi:hypothetical protein